MFFLNWTFILISLLILTFLCKAITLLSSFKVLLFNITITVYISGGLCYLHSLNTLSWGEWPNEHRWEKYKTSCLLTLLYDDEIDEEGIEMENIRKTSNQEFLSLLRKNSYITITERINKWDFLGRCLSVDNISKLNNLCSISVFLVALSYRLLINALLLPLKTVLTQFFFIVFVGYYIKLYFSIENKELCIPNLQDFIKSNLVLRHIFKDIIFEPDFNVRQHYRDGVNKRYTEWRTNTKRTWVSYTLYYYISWHICIVPYYGAFDHLQALNFILSNKRQCESHKCKTQLWVVPNTNTRALTSLFLILYILTLPGYKLHTWITQTLFNSWRLYCKFGNTTWDDEESAFKPKEIEDNKELIDLLKKPFYSIESDLNDDIICKRYINICQKVLMKDRDNYIFSVTRVGKFPLHAFVKALQDEITLIKYTYYEELEDIIDRALEEAKKKYNVY